MKTHAYAGACPLQQVDQPVSGGHIRINGEEFYCIENYDRMRPFFMSIVSDSDHWMFISSTGALTAGRRNANSALFPYYTDDRIHDSAGVTGSKTIFAARRRGREYLWTPFSDLYHGVYRTRRNLYKSIWSNKIIFEEINEDLSLAFRYGWFNSERYGFVRKAWLTNSGKDVCRIRIRDGIQNILPSGAGSQFQLEKSTLLDAYKRNELVAGTTLALYALSSIPIDRPEPAESLKATTVWSIGPGQPAILLRSGDLNSLLNPSAPGEQTEVRGERGDYLLAAEAAIPPGRTVDWMIVADVDQNHSQIIRARRLLRGPARLRKLVEDDIERGTVALRRITGSADGLQKTNRPLGDARHYSNVLFNVMRGGVFLDGCQVDPGDVASLVAGANRRVADRHAKWLARLRPGITYPRLVQLAADTGDPQLERICREYLPLTFSRRHGDPSRPWNRFSIASRDAKGRRILNYEGNWRDIFQNWEALSYAFPDFTSGMICKFVNASTVDGYNPYRITRDGLDWEVVDPHDPWSFIGYWGDHQVIYLLKLLEILRTHNPGDVEDLLSRRIFSYANVPYRIKDYASLLANPRSTVEFDYSTDTLTQKRVKEIGSDGKLIWDSPGTVHLVNLTEKLLVSLLAKLSNFIPEAGIWLNTQRPEWNDANNALVGNGASMVTLCYLRRCFAFLTGLFGQVESNDFPVSAEVLRLFRSIRNTLKQNAEKFGVPLDSKGTKRKAGGRDKDRKRVLDGLGQAGEAYRRQVYRSGFSGRQETVSGSELADFFDYARAWMDQSIAANKRSDGLYEAYNLVRFERDGIGIRRLYPMLEGQVAVLSSGLLSPNDSLEVLEALRRSSLFREDQLSYLLYPDRELPCFLKKNRIPRSDVKKSPLLRRLIMDGNHDVVERDEEGIAHFNGSIRNSEDLREKLNRLAPGKYSRLVAKDAPFVLRLFERIFDHESFTGRSGTFFAYEGLGSIYWHMVSKLLLAAQESHYRAATMGAQESLLRRLAETYYDIRAGIGDCKTPGNYGAFPMDPYSHTPRHKGASQPGLTGQVKEDILCRWGELGVFVEGGRIRFNPRLLRKLEFLDRPCRFDYFDADGTPRRIRLQSGSLAFTYCQTPVIYKLGKRDSVEVVFSNGAISRSESLDLGARASRAILSRTGAVRQVIVSLRSPGNDLR